MRFNLPILCCVFYLVAIVTPNQADASDIASSQSNKLMILSSIKPIQLIVDAITQDPGQSDVLIPATADPHHYSLKPSDIIKLTRADVIFRLHKTFETQLNKPLSKMNKVVVSLANSTNIRWLPLRHSHIYDKHDHSNDQQSPVDLDLANKDMHLWLSNHNAIIIAKAITATLSDLNPGKKNFYQSNFRQFQLDLHKLKLVDSLKIARSPSKQYFSLHDSFQYLEKHYRLHLEGTVKDHQDLPFGARSLYELYKSTNNKQIKCVIAPLSSKSNQTSRVFKKFGINLYYIDLFASQIGRESNAYYNYIKTINRSFIECINSNNNRFK